MPFWKKRHKEEAASSIARLPPDEYVPFIIQFVDEMDPATRAHIAVAYQNLIPLVSAYRQFNDERGLRFEIEDLLESLAAEVERPHDETNHRRFSWLYFAGLLARLEKLARHDEAIVPVGATLWTIIVTEYPKLRFLLPNNVVWKEDEKLWFDLELSDPELMELGINHHIPPKFAQHDIVRRFARDLGAIYLPSRTRLGFIP
jgi:hypothetical protein